MTTTTRNTTGNTKPRTKKTRTKSRATTTRRTPATTPTPKPTPKPTTPGRRAKNPASEVESAHPALSSAVEIDEMIPGGSCASSGQGYPRVPRPVTARGFFGGAIGYIGGLIAIAFLVGLLLENFKLVMTLAFPGVFILILVMETFLEGKEPRK